MTATCVTVKKVGPGMRTTGVRCQLPTCLLPFAAQALSSLEAGALLHLASHTGGLAPQSAGLGTHLAGQRSAEGGGPGEKQPGCGAVRAAAAVEARA